MMKKSKITSVKLNVAMDGTEYLEGFYVADQQGYIDPFIDECGVIIPEDLNSEEQVEWALKQVGKHLFYKELLPCAFVAFGKSYIV